jgi:hypothetical protein
MGYIITFITALIIATAGGGASTVGGVGEMSAGHQVGAEEQTSTEPATSLCYRDEVTGTVVCPND